MRSNPPHPWFDPIVSYMCCNEKMIRHYDRDIKLVRKYQCEYCKKRDITHWHHIIPRNGLGRHSSKNLIELCPIHHKMAEQGLIDVGYGVSFVWVVRKKKKIENRLYRKDIIPTLNISSRDYQEIIKKHLIIDSTIKQLIKHKRLNMLDEYISPLILSGLIKSIPAAIIK